MADFGYDVSDYVDVDQLFGTLADFDAMLAAADLGPNEGIVIRLKGTTAAR